MLRQVAGWPGLFGNGEQLSARGVTGHARGGGGPCYRWRMRTSLGMALAVLLVACGGGGGAGLDSGAGGVDANTGPDAYVPSDIAEFLATVPGLTFEERQTDYPGYRLFVLHYVQPVNHDDPNGRTFEQRIVLHHVDRAAPMILYTSGYYLFGLDYLSELGTAMTANQVSTEQRFFGTSVPDGLTADDWQYVTIAQAAADHHRIVQALAPYYNGIWLSTGHSKGGMTSIYHRRFYPDDVDATVAYVAPISFGAPDTRYEGFFDTVGTQACREALTAIQREALTRFSALLPMAQAEAQQNGLTYDRAGGQAAAFEGDIAGMNWSFWQYYGQCGSIPQTTATDQQVYDFVSTVGGIGSDDQSIGQLETYYYQAEAQLGYPAVPTSGVDDLLQYQDVTGRLLAGGHEPDLRRGGDDRRRPVGEERGRADHVRLRRRRPVVRRGVRSGQRGGHASVRGAGRQSQLADRRSAGGGSDGRAGRDRALDRGAAQLAVVLRHAARAPADDPGAAAALRAPTLTTEARVGSSDAVQKPAPPPGRAKSGLSRALVSLLPPILGATLAYAAVSAIASGPTRNFEDLALGKETTPYWTKIGGVLIHCTDSRNVDECYAGAQSRGAKVSALWLGNSQLHAINQYHSGDETAPAVLFPRLRAHGVNLVALSQPNATIPEHYVAFENARAHLPLRYLFLPVCFDDFRGQSIRSSIVDLLADRKTAAGLSEQPEGKKILKSHRGVGGDLAGLRNTVQERVERAFDDWLGDHFDPWNKRPQARGKTYDFLYRLRNSLFHITARSKRPKIPGAYRANLKALRALLESARQHRVSVVLYIVPLRDDVAPPYVAAEYAAFKTEMSQVADQFGARFVDLEHLVPARLWGSKDATVAGGGAELDFMHFQAGGHRLLADAIEREFDALLEQRGTP